MSMCVIVYVYFFIWYLLGCAVARNPPKLPRCSVPLHLDGTYLCVCVCMYVCKCVCVILCATAPGWCISVCMCVCVCIYVSMYNTLLR